MESPQKKFCIFILFFFIGKQFGDLVSWVFSEEKGLIMITQIMRIQTNKQKEKKTNDT